MRFPERRTGVRRTYGLAITVGLILGFLLVAVIGSQQGCDRAKDTPSGASSVTAESGSSSGAQSSSSSNPQPPTATAPTNNQLCQRSDITPNRKQTLESIAVNGFEVTGTCFATSSVDGDLFCKVYLDERGGNPNTTVDVGNEWGLTLPDQKSHKIVIDFELDVNGDGVTDCQNDGTNATVVAKIPPPPTGCQLDLECREQRDVEQSALEPQNVTKWIECNHPVRWQHNAAESNEGATTFHGFYPSRDDRYEGFWKATAQRDARCMVQDSFPVNPPVCVPERCEPGFLFNRETCACECDEQTLRELAANSCQHGVKSIDVHTCSFECKPPPRCEDDPPDPTYQITSGNLTRHEDQNGRENRVTVQGCGAVFSGEAVLEIFWQNGNSTRVKEDTRIKTACGKRESACISWSSSSSSHLTRNGACYTIRLNPVDGGVEPTKLLKLNCN